MMGWLRTLLGCPEDAPEPAVSFEPCRPTRLERYLEWKERFEKARAELDAEEANLPVWERKSVLIHSYDFVDDGFFDRPIEKEPEPDDVYRERLRFEHERRRLGEPGEEIPPLPARYSYGFGRKPQP